eukprot:TRINITY_DN48227_c0_g1_i1.p1 TRINITY_DN48227_c0_g1~~TRINITY_DN48227_c0_g1_i1.p1  ORF type:complete len:363 (+),score=110.27 TRINITY_DN48227_c0_g1_i1:93-1181(+)
MASIRQIFIVQLSIMCQLSWMLSGTSGEIISDLMTSEGDERKALQTRAENFWSSLQKVAKEMSLDEHVEIYEDVEAAMKDLNPESHSEVRKLLSEALEHLKRADLAVLKQGMQSSDVATEELSNAGRSSGEGHANSGIMIGGQKSFISRGLKYFVDGGSYNEALEDQVGKRQATVMPVLRGAADITKNVLQDTRLASKLGFDILKLDIYHSHVAKTPESVKKLANRIIDASSKTRRRFMKFVMSLTAGLVADVEGKTTSAAATMAQATLPVNAGETDSAPSTVEEDKTQAAGPIEEPSEESTEIVSASEEDAAPTGQRWVCDSKTDDDGKDRAESAEASTKASAANLESAEEVEEDEPFQGL